MSQQELAERSGLSVRAISNLERGRTRWPYPGSLHRLADALGLSDEARTELIAAAGRRLARAEITDRAGMPGGTGRRAGGQLVVPQHLPAAVPGFVGRHEQLAALSRILDQPGGTAVVAAYVLAGELAAARGDYRAAFGRYEQLLRPYVARGQKQARGGRAFLAPATVQEIRRRDRLFRMLRYLPAKPLIRYLSARTAAAIKLPSYLEPSA